MLHIHLSKLYLNDDFLTFLCVSFVIHCRLRGSRNSYNAAYNEARVHILFGFWIWFWFLRAMELIP